MKNTKFTSFASNFSGKIANKTFYGSDTCKLSVHLNAISGPDATPVKDVESGYLTWDKMPAEGFLADYYATTYVANNKCWYNPDNDYSPKPRQLGSIKKLAEKYFPNLQNKLRIHDLGCAFGGLVHQLRQAGFEATGTDLNLTAINQGRERGNFYIFNQSLDDFLLSLSSPPDIFISNHVLEHFIDPAQLVHSLHRHFGERTLGFFTFPNGNFYPALVGRYDLHGWYGYPDHLHLFGPAAGFRLFKDNGFEILEVASGSYNDFNKENILFCFSPLNPEAVIDYDSLRSALEKNFAGCELSFTFCKSNSEMALLNSVDIQKTLALFEKFQTARI